MSATIFGLSTTFVPQPDLRLSKDETGLVRANQTFTCKTASFNATIFNTTFRRGVSFTTLNTNAAYSTFSFLKLETAEAGDTGGDIVEVYATFSGTSNDFQLPGVGQPSEWNIQFTVNTSLVDAPIVGTSEFKSAAEYSSVGGRKVCAAIQGCIDGKYQRDPREDISDVSGSITIIDVQTQQIVALFNDQVSKDLYEQVVINGHHTKPTPRIEWTVETTNLYPLRQVDFSNLGKVHETSQMEYLPTFPPPNAPAGEEWMLSNLTQTQTGIDSFTRSKTWTTGVFPDAIFEDASYSQ